MASITEIGIPWSTTCTHQQITRGSRNIYRMNKKVIERKASCSYYNWSGRGFTYIYIYEPMILTWKRPQVSQACLRFAIVSTLFSPARSLKERTGRVDLLVAVGEVSFCSRNLDGTRVNPLSTCGCSNSMSVSARLIWNSPTAIGISGAINHQAAGICKLTRCYVRPVRAALFLKPAKDCTQWEYIHFW